MTARSSRCPASRTSLLLRSVMHVPLPSHHTDTKLTFLNIILPARNEHMHAQVANAAKSPITVVVMTGGALDISAIRDNAKVGAIVWAGYPGQSGGQGIADVLWGTYNPGE